MFDEDLQPQVLHCLNEIITLFYRFFSQGKTDGNMQKQKKEKKESPDSAGTFECIWSDMSVVVVGGSLVSSTLFNQAKPGGWLHVCY